MKGHSYEAVEKGNGEDEVLQYSCIEEQMKENKYNAKLEYIGSTSNCHNL